MRQMRQVSDALREVARFHPTATAIIPAMYGCPDCKTAWIIVSPAPIGNCRNCGVQMVVLTQEQIAIAVAAV